MATREELKKVFIESLKRDGEKMTDMFFGAPLLLIKLCLK